jgi:hypothetical protein
VNHQGQEIKDIKLKYEQKKIAKNSGEIEKEIQND